MVHQTDRPTSTAPEPTVPTRLRLIRGEASIELAKLSFALEKTEDARRAEKRLEQLGVTTHIEYEWLNCKSI